MRFVFGDCELDTERYELRRAGQVVPLEPKPFRVLVYLVQRQGYAVVKDDLYRVFWPGIMAGTYRENSLRNCLNKIRQTVGDVGTQGEVIETIRSYGYRFVAPVTIVPLAPLEAGSSPQRQEEAPPSPPLHLNPPFLPGQRQLTVLWCSLIATPCLENLDPEDFRLILQAFYTTCEQAVQPFEGYMAQYDSDGVLVYFGYPDAREDAPQRAVQAGLALLEAVPRLELSVESVPRLRLAGRLSLHTGPVVVDSLGGRTHGSPAVSGPMLNIAKRLHDHTTPNTIVLSTETYRMVHGYFVCEALATQPASRDHALPALYRVVAEDNAQSRFDVAIARGLTPLVGRTTEVALLLERWMQVKDGRGQVMLVSGESGIGKSRLVHELCECIGSEKYARIALRCSPYYQNSPLYPVRDHLRRFLQFHRDDPPEMHLEKLQRFLQSYRFAHKAILPLVAALLSLPHPEHALPLPANPERQKQLLQEALSTWLCEEAERQPVLLVWEDIHWADPSSVDLLTLFVEQVATARLFLVLTSRLEFCPPWGTRSHLTQLTLARFTRHQVEDLVLRVTGGKRLPAAVVEQVVAKTDGVPLFVEELTKMIVESPWLKESGEQYELRAPLSTLAIPATLHDSLLARLDRLATAKAVAQWGATLGRQFSYEQLQAVVPWDTETVQRALAKLVEAELLSQRGTPPQALYTFKHALIQDTAYQALLRHTRQQQHRRIADVLATQFPEVATTQPELLARHYTEAGSPEHAITYWQQAGQRALDRSGYPEAISHLTQGLELLKSLPDSPERMQHELSLHMMLGPALIATKGYATPEVGPTFERALTLCEQLGHVPQLFSARFGLWMFYVVRAELQTARELGEQCLTLAHHEQDHGLLLEAHFMLGLTLYYLGEFGQAHAHLAAGTTLYDPQQHSTHAVRYGQDPGIGCRGFAGVCLWFLGYPEQARMAITDMLTLAQEVAHPYSLAFAFFCAVWFEQLCQAPQATQVRATAEITLASEQGFQFWFVLARMFLGWALTKQGQHEEGMAQLHEGLTTYQAIGAELSRPYWHALTAELARDVGQTKEGHRALAEAFAVVKRTGERLYEAELYRLEGELLLQAGCNGKGVGTSRPDTMLLLPHTEKAERCFQQAVAIARRQQARSLELRATMSLCRLWQCQGRRTAAYDMLAPLYMWFTEGFDTADLQEAKGLLDELKPR